MRSCLRCSPVTPPPRVDHQLAVSSLLIHAVGATVWAGGLAALVFGRRLPTAVLARAVARYSRIALGCFLAVAASGLLNATARLDRVDALTDTVYGRVVVLKAAVLVAVAGLGWAHRARTIPALHAGMRRAFARIAAVEVLVLAATFGVAAALGRTPPAGPGREETLAESLLGFGMPEPLTARALVTGWLPEPLFLAAAITAVAFYLAGVRRLRRRGDAWPVHRTVCWLGGWAVVVVVTSSGLARYGPVLFSVHMVQHMTMTMLAPILLALAGPVTLGLRALRPASVDLPGPREWLLAALHSRPTRWLTHPLIALAIYVTGLYGMYFTGLYELALRSHAAHLAMFAHFLAAGYLFFWVLIGVDPAPRTVPHPLRIPLLFISMVFHAIFGLVIMQSAQPLAADWFTDLARPWGPSAVEDQQTGGGIAWAFGEIPSALVLLALFRQWIAADEREQRRLDRAADRIGTPPTSPGASRPADGTQPSGEAPLADRSGEQDALSAYNRYLARLNDRADR